MVKSRLVWIVAAIGTVLSLLVQYCVRATLGSENSPETIPLLPDVLHLTYLLPYKAFSFSANTNQLVLQVGILSILAIIAGTFFVSWLLSKSNKKIMKSLQIGVGLLLAGSISNTVERFLFNEISVFIDIRLFKTPIFNLADVFINLGLVISIISIMFLGLKFAVSQWQRS